MEGVAAPFVSADDAVAMDIAVSHLAQLGHRRIGLAIGPGRFMPSARKHEGFVHALGTHLGQSANEARSWIAETIFSVEGGAAATGQLLEQGATAIVCGSDMMAIGAEFYLAASGRSTQPADYLLGEDVFTPAAPGMERFFERGAAAGADVEERFAKFARDAGMKVLGPRL